jgi:hypothetical protein
MEVDNISKGGGDCPRTEGARTMQVTVYKVTRAGFDELHRFNIDPTKTSYVHLEKSELGFSFVVDDKEIPPPEGDGGHRRSDGEK